MSEETKTGNESNSGTGGQKVEFSPEQQAHIDTLFNKRFAEVNSKAEAKYKGEMDTLKSQLAESQTKKGDGKEGIDVEAMKVELEAAKADREFAREEWVNNSLLTALSKHPVVDSGELVRLLRGNIKMDDKRNISVVNDNGEVKYNAQGGLMSVDEFVGAWLTTKPHHLRAAGSIGAGSQGARFGVDTSGNPLTVDVVKNMSIEDLKKAMATGINIPGSAGQVFKFKDNKNTFRT